MKFISVIKDSNRAIEQLAKDIDLEEIRIAKEYQEQGRIRREELNQMLDDNDADDREIQDELNRIEKEMIKSEFDRNPISTPVQQSPIRQPQVTQSNMTPTSQQRLLMN